MARFDVYANPDREERQHTPFILDLQNGLFDILQSFVAVPLRIPGKILGPLWRVHPRVTVMGLALVVDTPMMATFPKRGAGRPVDNLRRAQFEIQDALDALLGDV